jgi:DNA-binding response OmpR family regulator
MNAFALSILNSPADYVVTFSDVEVNLDRGTVHKSGRRVYLSAAEFDLLACFIQNPDRTLSRDLLLQSVWCRLPDPSTRTVDSHVMRLRRKLEPDPATPRHFLTLHRAGYRFSPRGMRAGSAS